VHAAGRPGFLEPLRSSINEPRVKVCILHGIATSRISTGQQTRRGDARGDHAVDQRSMAPDPQRGGTGRAQPQQGEASGRPCVEVLDVEGINLGARDLETRESQRKIKKIDLGMNIGSGSGTHHGQEKSTQCSESDLKILSGNMRSGSGLGPCKKTCDLEGSTTQKKSWREIPKQIEIWTKQNAWRPAEKSVENERHPSLLISRASPSICCWRGRSPGAAGLWPS
jgi:hypothetical protein